MTNPIIAVADSVFPSLDPAMEILSKLNAEVTLAKNSTPEAIIEVAHDADALMVTFAQISGEVIAGLKNCRVIGRFGIGVDNIGVDAATKAGIQVCYVPDYCLDEVSDHALALLMSLARKITYSNALVQKGRWEGKAVAPLWRLRGRTLGLVGLGKIPQTLVPKAQALGLSVVRRSACGTCARASCSIPSTATRGRSPPPPFHPTDASSHRVVWTGWSWCGAPTWRSSRR